jgi:lipopolysaccharide biosynthesis glycosyltransferase
LDEIASFGEIAAVSLDLSIASGLDDPAIFERSKRHGLSPYYFNSGLMIINTRKWRETCAEERFSENFVRHQRCCPYFSVCPTHDQCVLNMTLGGDAKLLPVAWNVQKSALQTHSWENAIVRHYTGARKFIPIRPWTCDRREYALLQSISKECGLQPLNSTYDFGISYALNKIRRRKTVAKYERAISAINAALATIV